MQIIGETRKSIRLATIVGTNLWWAALAAIVLIGLCTRLAIGGLPVQTGYPFATSILLDAGSRINAGQVPYVDFHTPIGFAYLGLISIFMKLAQGLPHALALLSACAGLVVGAWAWWLAIARLPAPLAAAAAVLCGLLVATPAFFGYGTLDVSYGGHYSRLAWGLFATVIIQAAIAPRTTSGTSRIWIEGLGIGLVLGLLLGIKFSFLFAAGIVLLAAWSYRKPEARLVMMIPVGVGVAVVAGLGLSGATLSAYLRDCASLSSSVPLLELLWQYMRKLDFLALALIAVIALWTWPTHRATWSPSWRHPLPEAAALAVVILVMGIILSATTGIEDASPCYVLVILVLASGRPGTSQPTSEAGPTALRPAVLIAGAVLCAFAARLALPIIKGPYAAASHQLTLKDGPWRGLDFMPAVPGVDEKEQLIQYLWIQPRNLVDNLWYLYLSDADRILRPRVGQHQRVLSMDYINPFPYQLGRPAPRGDLLYWSFDRNVTLKTAPKAEVLFAEADWVMVPKVELFHGSAKTKKLLYLDWIISHYRLEESSIWWDCYRR